MGVKFTDRIVDNVSERRHSYKKSFYNNIIYTILISNIEYKKSRERELQNEELKKEEIKKHNKIQNVYRSSGRIERSFYVLTNSQTLWRNKRPQ